MARLGFMDVSSVTWSVVSGADTKHAWVRMRGLSRDRLCLVILAASGGVADDCG